MIVWYEQEHQASCVAACLRMVGSALGQQLSEREVRQLLGNPRFGLTLGKASLKLIEANVIAEYHSDWGLDDLRDSIRDGNYPIGGVERRFFGYASAAHAVVRTSVRSIEIMALDPLIGPQPQTYKLATFERAWKIAGKETLILQSLLPS
jgi:ABC-type bacteriocin/lantibiotic exporter with double-glycine peptidase domain